MSRPLKTRIRRYGPSHYIVGCVADHHDEFIQAKARSFEEARELANQHLRECG